MTISAKFVNPWHDLCHDSLRKQRSTNCVMSGLVGLVLFVGSIIWLAALIVTGFSMFAVSAGLLTAVCLLGRADGG